MTLHLAPCPVWGLRSNRLSQFVSRLALYSLLLLSVAVSAEDTERLYISDFSETGLSEWEPHSFEGDTEYSLLDDSLVEQKVIVATSSGSASGLVYKRDIDLGATPFLNWSWKIDKGLDPLEEQTKDGDDYAARIYVVVSGGWFFWKTKALNMVWSSRMSKGESWPNAFAPDNARMVSVRDRSDPTGQWVQEKVNVRQLLSEWLGEDIQEVHALAIMTDTDNSGKSAAARYGNLFFSTN